MRASGLAPLKDMGSIDVALVPYWFFFSPGGPGLIAEHLPDARLVALHVPPEQAASVAAELAPRGVHAFARSMERHVVSDAAPESGNDSGNDGKGDG